jgi:hypothetical protein
MRWNGERVIGSAALWAMLDAVGVIGHIIHWPRRAKAEVRVCAGGVPDQ